MTNKEFEKEIERINTTGLSTLDEARLKNFKEKYEEMLNRIKELNELSEELETELAYIADNFPEDVRNETIRWVEEVTPEVLIN